MGGLKELVSASLLTVKCSYSGLKASVISIGQVIRKRG